MPRCRSNPLNIEALMPPPFAPRKTISPSSWSFRAYSRIPRARLDRGTRCSRFAFMRLAGMVQTS